MPTHAMSVATSFTKELPPLNRILVVGNGGRENALAWALRRSLGIQKVFVSPGNGGTEKHEGCKRLNVNETDLEGLLNICISNLIDLIVIGPEVALAAGIGDGLRKAGFAVFGPGADGAQLEASKSWAKALMAEANIPTAKHWSVSNEQDALSILQEVNTPLVVKADGLAAGKGVTVSDTVEQSFEAIKETFSGKFGVAGSQIVLEERLEGPEISVFALCDSERLLILPCAQDHKRLKEGDQGPNTGGMGAYAPAPQLNEEELKNIQKIILEPTLKAMKSRNINYRGVIYAGLMMTSAGPQIIEFNCRFGDPECQTLMPLMGPELAKVLQACALGCLDKAPPLSILDSCSACVVAAASGYPESPRKGDSLKIGLDSNSTLQIFHAGTNCNEKGELFTTGGRVLSVVTQAGTFEEAFRLAYKSLKEIHFDGMTYRKDIGNQVRNSTFLK